MLLKVKRTTKREDYTAGHLFIDGQYFCDTIEPHWRNLAGGEKKVAGQTAIPEGRYLLLVTRSPKFGCFLPLVWQVPQFEGVRIHAGNTARDSRGCILVGYREQHGRIVNSRSALVLLMDRLTQAQRRSEKLEIVVE